MAKESDDCAKTTVTLTVKLDPTAEPPVIISNRNQTVPSGSQIEWVRASGEAFKFIHLKGDPTNFINRNVLPEIITCDFVSDKPSNSKHPYSVFLTDGNEIYHSDDMSMMIPDDGKAVIRN